MSENPSPEIYDLYGEAAELLDPVLQEAFLQAHCGHDPQLLAQLRAMLAVREDADALFEAAATSDEANEGLDKALDETAFLGRVGHFRLQRLVGRGGMGNVFLAIDERLQRPVALKFPRLDTMGNPQLQKRFLQEARLAARLSHPNLVEIYEVGVWGHACFIAAQWCEGGDLAVWLAEHPGPQEPRWSATLVRALARAVAYCHQQGVVHLDLKPANVILAPDPEDPAAVRPLLTDFGVARVVEENLTNTHSSLLLGTPLYMAPEQAECDRTRIGPASDIYALGVILHELLFGQRPYDGDSAMAVLDQIRSGETLRLPRAAGVPRELGVICQRCLQYEPAARYPSADALAEDLDRHLRGEPIHARAISLLQRLGRWFQRPERITQAGVAAIAIQGIILLDLQIIVLVMALGASVHSDTSLGAIAMENLVLGFVFHVPALVLGWMTVRRRAWSVPAGTLLSLVTATAMAYSAAKTPITLYDNNPLAALLVHLSLLGAMFIQTSAYLAAIPAVIRLRK